MTKALAEWRSVCHLAQEEECTDGQPIHPRIPEGSGMEEPGFAGSRGKGGCQKQEHWLKFFVMGHLDPLNSSGVWCLENFNQWGSRFGDHTPEAYRNGGEGAELDIGGV